MLRSFEIARADELTALRHDGGTRPVEEGDVLPELDAESREMVFHRIFQTFGSHATYQEFDDVKPFLRWARRNRIVTGVISNADERYGDAILPMLDLSDDIDFCVFSKEARSEKPSKAIFLQAQEQASRVQRRLYHRDLPRADGTPPLVPLSEMLHVGNDFEKDFRGAKDAGMNSMVRVCTLCACESCA